MRKMRGPRPRAWRPCPAGHVPSTSALGPHARRAGTATFKFRSRPSQRMGAAPAVRCGSGIFGSSRFTRGVPSLRINFWSIRSSASAAHSERLEFVPHGTSCVPNTRVPWSGPRADLRRWRTGHARMPPQLAQAPVPPSLPSAFRSVPSPQQPPLPSRPLSIPPAPLHPQAQTNTVYHIQLIRSIWMSRCG